MMALMLYSQILPMTSTIFPVITGPGTPAKRFPGPPNLLHHLPLLTNNCPFLLSAVNYFSARNTGSLKLSRMPTCCLLLPPDLSVPQRRTETQFIGVAMLPLVIGTYLVLVTVTSYSNCSQALMSCPKPADRPKGDDDITATMRTVRVP